MMLADGLSYLSWQRGTWRNLNGQEIITRKNQRKPFTFIDLFAGIGGMRIPFESIGGRCIFTSELNRFSLQTYRANFDCNHMVAGDIREVDESAIPDHDVLLAGFPCQPFSIAGISKRNALGRASGFSCKRQGTLFFDVVRILGRRRPPMFLLENVRNLGYHDRGRTLEAMVETLEGLGYTCDWRIIDAGAWVPQHRERIFITGSLHDRPPSLDGLIIPSAKPKLHSTLHPENGSEEPEPPYTEGKMAKVAEKYTLTDSLWRYLQDYAERHHLKGNGFGFGLVGHDGVARTLSARYHKDGSEILVRQEGRNPRRLTPRECARLMGFGESFRIPVSDTQAYRQFGNAVVIPVVRAIAEHAFLPVLRRTYQ
jgi:DNA (cytosine-5)-methyltransferase 1